jgi:hypothetical protein
MYRQPRIADRLELEFRPAHIACRLLQAFKHRLPPAAALMFPEYRPAGMAGPRQ